MDEEHHKTYPDIVVGLGRISAGVIFAYFFLNIMMVLHEGDLKLINTPMGYWYLTEVIGLVLIPGLMFIHGAQNRNLSTVRVAAILALIGIILNRLNCVFIAFKWYLPLGERYYPYWMELWITLSIIFMEIWVFRWIVNRMAVMKKPPEWAAALEKH